MVLDTDLRRRWRSSSTGRCFSIAGASLDSDEGAASASRCPRTLLNSWIEDKRFDGKAAVTFYPAFAEGDDVEIGGVRFPVLRRQRKGIRPIFHCQISFAAARCGRRYSGVFVATAGNVLAEEASR